MSDMKEGCAFVTAYEMHVATMDVCEPSRAVILCSATETRASQPTRTRVRRERLKGQLSPRTVLRRVCGCVAEHGGQRKREARSWRTKSGPLTGALLRLTLRLRPPVRADASCGAARLVRTPNLRVRAGGSWGLRRRCGWCRRDSGVWKDESSPVTVEARSRSPSGTPAATSPPTARPCSCPVGVNSMCISRQPGGLYSIRGDQYTVLLPAHQRSHTHSAAGSDLCAIPWSGWSLSLSARPAQFFAGSTSRV